MITLQRLARPPVRSLARPLTLFLAACSSRQKRFCNEADDPVRPALVRSGQTTSVWGDSGRCRVRMDI